MLSRLLHRRARYGLAFLALLAVWLVWPSSYRFDLRSRIVDREDVFSLVGLAADLRQVQQWDPEYIAPAAVGELAAWIRFADNLNAVSIGELGRDNSASFHRVNGQVLLLDRSGQGDLSSLRELDVKGLEEELARRLAVCRDQRRDASYAKIVMLPENQRLLARCDCPPFPMHATSMRGRLAKLLGRRSADREHWVAGFLAAVEQDITLSALRYSSIDRQNVIPLASSGPGRLELHKRRNTSLPPTIYAGDETTSDFDLRWLATPEAGAGQEAASENVVRSYDTGIRIVRTAWQRSQPDSDGWRPVWPPPSSQIGCRLDRLRDFLREFGLPDQAILRTATIVEQGSWEASDLRLHVELTSADFPQWRHSLVLSLSNQSPESLRAAVASRITEHDEQFLTQVVAETSLCGLQAEFTRSRFGRSVDAIVQHPQLGGLPVRGSLRHDGRFDWEPQLTLQQRVRAVEQLVVAEPRLSGQESRITLDKMQLDPAHGQLQFAFQFQAPPDEPAPSPIVWTVDRSRAVESAVSTPDRVLELPAPAARPATGIMRDELEREIARVLRAHYSALAPHVAAIASIRSAGAEFRLGLRIGDWKELDLGPALIDDLAAVAPNVDLLLSAASVKAASIAQWKEAGEFHHPRYGKITTEITDWTADPPRATLRSAVTFRDLGEIPWFEDARLNGEEWTQLDAALLADRLEGTVVAGLDSLNSLVSQYIPADAIALRLDRTGIDGNRWLDLNPPRIALQGAIRLNILGDVLPGVRLAGIIVDSEGLHIPEEYGFILPGTFSLPYFSISEPSVMLGLSRSSLQVGAKLTPPAAPGPLPNPWLNVLCSESSLRGYWNRLQFDGLTSIHLAGTADVAHGSLSTNFSNASLTGELRAGGRLPGLPSVPARLGGSLEASAATRAIEVQTRAHLFNNDVSALWLEAGDAKTRRNVDPRIDDPYGFGIRGRIRVPMIAHVNVVGESSSSLDRYTIKGRGSAGPYSCVVTATEAEVRMYIEYQTETGVTYWEEWDPHLTSLNQPDPDGVASPGKQPVFCGRSLSPREEAFARRTFTGGDGDDDIRTHGGSVPGESISPSHYASLPNPEFDRGADGSLQISRQGALVVEIPAAQLPAESLRGWTVKAWRAEDGSGHVLFINHGGRRARHVAFAGPKQTTAVNELPQLSLQSSEEVDQVVGKSTLERHFRLTTLDADVIRDVTAPALMAKGDAIAFQYRFNDAPLSAVWACNPIRQPVVPFDVHAGIAHLPESATDARDELHDLLIRQRPDHNLPRVVAVDQESESVGWYLADSRDSLRGTVMVTRADGQLVKSCEFAFYGGGLSFLDRLERSQSLVRTVWLQPALMRGTAWLGAQGVLVEAGDELWIIRDRGPRPPHVARLARKAFDNWASETANKLPGDWRTVEQRSALDAQAIAATALAHGFESADRLVEPVNRLGLLLTLSSEQELSDNE